MSSTSEIFLNIQKSLAEFTGAQFLQDEDDKTNKEENFIRDQISQQSEHLQQRLFQEFFEYGPLNLLFEDADITEILVNAPDSIWFEKKGRLQRHDDLFYSPLSYTNILERMSQKSNGHVSLNRPYLESKFFDFRITLVDACLGEGHPILSLRRHPKIVWNFERLMNQGWCSNREFTWIQSLIQNKRNFLIVGETGSGKTSVANACLQLLENHERALTIEDCSEIKLPNDSSLKLLTREDPNGLLSNVTQQDLLRRALRLRPDRLVMGEIRGPEAKDFLMMLSTGHEGSFATLHARDPQEALIRLEMLVQLGAPQWSLQAIRKLIFLSLSTLVVVGRDSQGTRKLKGVYRLTSLEESGFTLEPMEDCTLAAVSSE